MQLTLWDLEEDQEKFRKEIQEEIRVEYIHPMLKKRAEGPEQRLGQRYFLHRQVPLGWVTRLLQLSPAAIRVGLALVNLQVLSKKPTLVLKRSLCLQFSITPSQKSRGLKSLSQAGLIQYTPHPRINPQVTLQLNPHPPEQP
jgi:DNA-binding MarR family transcriptional regulator